MLAWLLRLVLIAVFVLAGSLLTWGLAAGQPGWGLAAALAVFAAQPLMLGVEFMLQRKAHGNDPTPRPTTAALWAAWQAETSVAVRVFFGRQPFLAAHEPDHLPLQAQGRRGVLLLHGFICNRGLWNPWLRRLGEQGVPVVAATMEPVFGSIDDCAPAVESAMRQLEQCTGMRPIVVAHSMGGLVLRSWWAGHDGDSRVQHAITIASPHHGTVLARWALWRNARQMQRGSPWLKALAGAEPVERYRRFTCFFGACDNIVFPPLTATLDGADNRHLPGIAHMKMIESQSPWQALQTLLQPHAGVDHDTPRKPGGG